MKVVVTGASRGVGKGIALSFAEIGAEIVVTGRTLNGNSSLQKTSAEIESRGGTAIPIQCDHSNDEQVIALFKRIEIEFDGSIDVLVNNAWGGNEIESSSLPFWQHNVGQVWDKMINLGVRSHFFSSCHGISLMKRGGLIIHTGFWDNDKYAHSPVYDLALNAINRLSYALALELVAEEVASVALSPGFVRTERVIDAYAEDPSLSEKFGGMELTESPEYIGRASVALATDADIMSKSGCNLQAGALAEEYGFDDIDGKRHSPFVLPISEKEEMLHLRQSGK